MGEKTNSRLWLRFGFWFVREQLCFVLLKLNSPHPRCYVERGWAFEVLHTDPRAWFHRTQGKPGRAAILYHFQARLDFEKMAPWAQKTGPLLPSSKTPLSWPEMWDMPLFCIFFRATITLKCCYWLETAPRTVFTAKHLSCVFMIPSTVRSCVFQLRLISKISVFWSTANLENVHTRFYLLLSCTLLRRQPGSLRRCCSPHYWNKKNHGPPLCIPSRLPVRFQIAIIAYF